VPRIADAAIDEAIWRVLSETPAWKPSTDGASPRFLAIDPRRCAAWLVDRLYGHRRKEGVIHRWARHSYGLDHREACWTTIPAGRHPDRAPSLDPGTLSLSGSPAELWEYCRVRWRENPGLSVKEAAQDLWPGHALTERRHD